jgi:hypothetical protein
MSFDIKQNQSKKFEKTAFLKLDEGNHVVRILEDEGQHVFTHFVLGKITVACLDDNCPVCENNAKIRMESPENFRTVSAYSPRVSKYSINVLDKTPAKVCPKCQTANTVKAVNCANEDCKNLLVDVRPTPENKVKIATLSTTLATQLNMIEKTITDAESNPVGWKNFDIILSVAGAGRDKVITTIPNPAANAPVELGEQTLIEHAQAVLRLTRQEITDLLHGVALRDILVARKPAADTTADRADEETKGVLTGVSNATLTDINAKIAEIYGS